ncbi:MAG: hypothetical protein AB1705_06245 [Verrucomicrobiota bacterium]
MGLLQAGRCGWGQPRAKGGAFSVGFRPMGMKKVVVLVAVVLLGCRVVPEAPVSVSKAPAASDAIERLVARLSASRGMWQNGLFPRLDVPANATAEQVATKAFEMSRREAMLRILETRKVRIPDSLPDQFTAVLVESQGERKIVLVQYVSEAVGWWSRVYEVKDTL